MIDIEIVDFSCNFVKAHLHHRPRFVKNTLRIFEKEKTNKKIMKKIKNLYAIHYNFLAAITQVLE